MYGTKIRHGLSQAFTPSLPKGEGGASDDGWTILRQAQDEARVR
jgi:hypothetical protein